MDDLIKRLRRTLPYNNPVSLQPQLLNPDGPEAADTLERMREAMKHALSHRYGDWTGILEEALQETKQ